MLKFPKKINKEKVKEYIFNFSLYRSKDEVLHGAAILFFIIATWWVFSISAPSIEKVPFTIEIEKGESIKEISTYLKKENI